jgi:phage uncharacterized protein TIGR01671
MREIKFRAKIVGSDKWIYGSLIVRRDHTDGYLNYYIEDLNNEDLVVLVNYNTIGQYIGLKDWSHKEIYEGDIIKFSNENGVFIGVFIWEEENEMHYGKWALETSEDISDEYENRDEDYFEVIGNIHDNPELLEVK